MAAVGFILFGYVALIATWGWPGAVAAALHLAVMLGALRR